MRVESSLEESLRTYGPHSSQLADQGKGRTICDDIREKEIEGDGQRRRDQDSGIICHDGKKLLFVDLSVLVEIKFVDHGLAGEGCEVRAMTKEPTEKNSQLIVL
jgi:hypothetical protein